MLTRWFQDWLRTQSLGVRMLFNGIVVAVSLWLAFATGRFAFLIIGFVIAVLTFTLDDVRQARDWLNR